MTAAMSHVTLLQDERKALPQALLYPRLQWVRKDQGTWHCLPAFSSGRDQRLGREPSGPNLHCESHRSSSAPEAKRSKLEG